MDERALAAVDSRSTVTAGLNGTALVQKLDYYSAMNEKTNYSTIYLRFLNLMQAIRELPTFPNVDPVEERLLNALAAIWHGGGRVTVLEAMALPVDVSPTTLHRRLKSLRAKGLLALETDAVDTRIKYVVPTDRTNEYFSTLGRCLNEAGQA